MYHTYVHIGTDPSGSLSGTLNARYFDTESGYGEQNKDGLSELVPRFLEFVLWSDWIQRHS